HHPGVLHRAGDARGRGVQVAGRLRGHGGPEPGGHRHLTGSGRRRAGEAEDHRDALRRTPGAVDEHDHADPVTPRRRVAVIAGGRSSEHSISIASARSVLAALDPERYETTAIEIGNGGRWALGGGAQGELPVEVLDRATGTETLPVVADSSPARVSGHVDGLLPILHGPFGEDGTVQGLLELAGVPYVGA